MRFLLRKKILPESPVNREALEVLERGLVNLERKQWEEAKADFKKAIELEPEYAAAYFYLGSVLFEQELFREAIAAFEHALVIDPYNKELEELVSNVRELIDIA